jgi:hypothetical protein
MATIDVGLKTAGKWQCSVGFFNITPNARCRLLRLWMALPPALLCHQNGCCYATAQREIKSSPFHFADFDAPRASNLVSAARSNRPRRKSVAV